MGLHLDSLIFDPVSRDGAKVGSYLIDADGHILNINADGSLNVSLGTVTDLDIRNLVFATDKVDVSGSTVALDSTSLAALENITVTVSNEVEIKNDAGNPVPVNGTVALDAGTLAALETITVVATDLDIRNLIETQDRVRSIDKYTGAASSAVNASTTVTNLVPSPLSNRVSVEVQNLGSKEAFIGFANTVTTSNGLRLNPGASASFKLDTSVGLWGITPSGTANIRIAEFSA